MRRVLAAVALATDFDWDRFYVIPPYSSNEQVDRRLGFEWGKAENSDYRSSDGGHLLLFVRDGDVVHAFDQPNGDGDFGCVGERGLTPRQAVLRVRRVHEEHGALDVVRGPGRLGRGCPFD
jgi:hypothetical protein